LNGVMAALPCYTKAKTQMKLLPNEFVGSILKDRGPWTMVLLTGVPPFDLLVTSLEFGEVTPASRSVGLGPGTSSTTSSLGASCVPRRPAQSNLLRSA